MQAAYRAQRRVDGDGKQLDLDSHEHDQDQTQARERVELVEGSEVQLALARAVPCGAGCGAAWTAGCLWGGVWLPAGLDALFGDVGLALQPRKPTRPVHRHHRLPHAPAAGA